jgi:hypothetical protein
MENETTDPDVQSLQENPPEFLTAPIETPSPEPDAVDVAGLMRQAEEAPSTEVPLSGPISGEAAKKKGRQAKPKDPLLDLLKDANFGRIAVAAQNAWFRACEAPALSEDEEKNTDRCTTLLMHHLLKSTKDAGELVPVLAFVSAMTIPVMIRAEPIGRASAPFLRSVADWCGARFTELRERFNPSSNGAKRER